MPTGETRFSKDSGVRIGDWRLDLQSSRLERPGATVHLEPRLCDLLSHLAHRPGTVISKDELLESVWQGRTLDAAAVPRAIAELRKALGDTASAPTYIETIPKRGYRLVAGVEVPRSPRSRALVAALLVLVLGLVLVVRRPASHDDTQTRDSSFGTTDGEALDAYEKATAALQRGGQTDNENAVVHLTRALELDPDFALARAGLAEAYSVRATWYGADADWSEAALAEASRAVALSPESPVAHRALGFALSANLRFGDAEASYRRAVTLDSNDELSVFRLGQLLGYRGEWPEALAILTGLADDAIGSSTACTLGQVLQGLGYAAEAERAFGEALEISPLGLCANIHLAIFDMVTGNLEASRRRTERLSAANKGCCDQLLGDIAFRDGRNAEAAEFFERALEWAVEPKASAMRIRLAQIRDDTESLQQIGIALERELTAGVDIHFPASLLMIVSAALEQPDAALRWQHEAMERGYLDWRWDLAEPTFETLRGTPEFDSAITSMRQRIQEMRNEVEARGLLEPL